MEKGAKERSWSRPAFHPKAILNMSALAGLLACSERLPVPTREQWQGVFFYIELTAAGTAPDFHRIPL